MCMSFYCTFVFARLARSAHGGEKRKIDSPTTGVTDGCEPLCRDYEWSPILEE